MKKLSVHLVTWNGEKYLTYLFDSLKKQTFKDWDLYIWDNNSSDTTIALIEQELQNIDIKYYIYESSVNHGFAGAHNKLFLKNDSEYILLLNQDMYLNSDCFEKMILFMDFNSNVASVSPRLMYWDFENNKHTDIIDSLGLKVFRNRRVIEMHSQKEWKEVSEIFINNAVSVFGVSGALPMYRRTALNQVLYKNGCMFDDSYHSYKEDVDLAFRLQERLYSSYILLDTKAFHDRTSGGVFDKSDKTAKKNKGKQSDLVRYHSYMNHIRNIYKHEYITNLILDFPYILWYEFKKLIYMVIYDRQTLKSLEELFKNIKDLKEKRKWIMSQRQATSKEMRKWWI